MQKTDEFVFQYLLFLDNSFWASSAVCEKLNSNDHL